MNLSQQTGYAREDAIRLPTLRVDFLSTGAYPAGPRARRYGKEVQEALSIAWAATNYIGSKRLAPFLEELVPVLRSMDICSLSRRSPGPTVSYQSCDY